MTSNYRRLFFECYKELHVKKAYICGWISIFGWNFVFTKQIVVHLPKIQVKSWVFFGNLYARNGISFEWRRLTFEVFTKFNLQKQIYLAGFRFLDGVLFEQSRLSYICLAFILRFELYGGSICKERYEFQVTQAGVRYMGLSFHIWPEICVCKVDCLAFALNLDGISIFHSGIYMDKAV